MNPYCDSAFADSYFNDRPHSEKWQECSEKEKFLKYATVNIYDYSEFRDEFNRPFSYGEGLGEKNIYPDALKRAVCEQALYLLNLGSKDPTQVNVPVIQGVSSTGGNVMDKKMRADILGFACVRIIRNMGGCILDGGTADSGAACSGMTR